MVHILYIYNIICYAKVSVAIFFFKLHINRFVNNVVFLVMVSDPDPFFPQSNGLLNY